MFGHIYNGSQSQRSYRRYDSTEVNSYQVIPISDTDRCSPSSRIQLRYIAVIVIAAIMAVQRFPNLDFISEYKFKSAGLDDDPAAGRINIKPMSYSDRSHAIKGLLATDGDGAWMQSHQPVPMNQSNVHTNTTIRSSFRLHDNTNHTYVQHFLSVENYMCQGQLPPSLNDRSILTFGTTTSTNLKILFIGDSIAQQFAQGFYASVLDEDHVHGHIILDSIQSAGQKGLHVHKSLVAPTRGGGVVAFWRSTSLMTNGMEGYINYMKEMGDELVQYKYAYPASAANELVLNHTEEHRGSNGVPHYATKVYLNETGQRIHTVGSMDACVVRLPHGWIKLQDITRDHLVQHIDNCNKIAGCETVIISTLPFNNNVQTPSDWHDLIKINEMIRNVARNWIPRLPEEGGPKTVLVQEFGNYTNQILLRNAQQIGYNTSTPDFAKVGWEKELTDILLHRHTLVGGEYPPSIPMVCGYPLESWSVKKELDQSMPCQFNMISRDGAHWCVECIGPRYDASVACLLGCVYNEKDPIIGRMNFLLQCEQQCNDQFMSLNPVDEKWIGTNTTIYSK